MGIEKDGMLITHEREKLIDAIDFFTKKTKYCGLTKLFKLLFFLDFIHFRQTGRSVTKLEYFAWPRGPVPRKLFFEMKGTEKSDLQEHVKVLDPAAFREDQNSKKPTKIRVTKGFKKKYFTKRELKIMEELAEVFKDAKAVEISEVSHLPGTPWDKTVRGKGMNAAIDYMLALDGSDKRQLDTEEIVARLKEAEEIRRALG